MDTENQSQLLTTDAIREEVLKAYTEARELAQAARDNGRAAILRMADCGQMIILGRENIRGSKNEWIAELGIPLEDATKAVSLARNREQLNLELWPQDVAKMGAQLIGMLPPSGASNREENDPERTTKKSDHWLGYVRKLSSSFDHLFERRPLDDWRADERESVKKALEPLAKLYAEL